MSDVIRTGGERPYGLTTCGYGLTDQRECGQPATIHICWLGTNATSTSCDQHFAEVRDRGAAEPYEHHTFKGDCGMPGTLWHTPYEDELEGYCLFPAADDASALIEVTPEPVMRP